MATNQISTGQHAQPVPPTSSREWQQFALVAFARIVARKHDLVVPMEGYLDLSDEELATRLRLVSELAHLPPA